MVKLMDCTLRDGENGVGKGCSADLTRSMLNGLVGAAAEAGIRVEECSAERTNIWDFPCCVVR